MAIKSIKNKLTSIASGEILGQADDNREPIKKAPPKKKEQVKPKKEKAPKRKAPKKNINKKENVNQKSDNKNNIENEYLMSEKSIKGAIDGYEDVLSILGIKKELNLDVDFESDDMDYIEFSQTTPLGFDFDEVTDFISRTKYTLNKLESALEQRNREIVIVASEVKKVEQKMIEKNQEMELAKMIGDMTEEERLIAENIDLKIEINELKGRLVEVGSSSQNSVDIAQFEALKAENEMLRNSIQQSEPKESSMPNLDEFKRKDSSKEKADLPLLDDNFNEEKKSKGLPEIEPNNLPDMNEIDLSNDDAVDSMIRDMGGLYDEEG